MTPMSAVDSFKKEIDDYLQASGVSASAFGKAALKDPNFVRNLRAGRSPGLKVVDQVREYIRANPAPAGTTSAEAAQ